jgi:hypothetical protein
VRDDVCTAATLQNGRIKGEGKKALRAVIEKYGIPVTITANQVGVSLKGAWLPSRRMHGTCCCRVAELCHTVLEDHALARLVRYIRVYGSSQGPKLHSQLMYRFGLMCWCGAEPDPA